MRILDSIIEAKFKIIFKNNIIKYVKIVLGRFIGSFLKDGKLWVTVSINKDAKKKMKKLMNRPDVMSVVHVK